MSSDVLGTAFDVIRHERDVASGQLRGRAVPSRDGAPRRVHRRPEPDTSEACETSWNPHSDQPGRSARRPSSTSTSNGCAASAPDRTAKFSVVRQKTSVDVVGVGVVGVAAARTRVERYASDPLSVDSAASYISPAAVAHVGGARETTWRTPWTSTRSRPWGSKPHRSLRHWLACAPLAGALLQEQVRPYVHDRAGEQGQSGDRLREQHSRA